MADKPDASDDEEEIRQHKKGKPVVEDNDDDDEEEVVDDLDSDEDDDDDEEAENLIEEEEEEEEMDEEEKTVGTRTKRKKSIFVDDRAKTDYDDEDDEEGAGKKRKRKNKGDDDVVIDEGGRGAPCTIESIRGTVIKYIPPIKSVVLQMCIKTTNFELHGRVTVSTKFCKHVRPDTVYHFVGNVESMGSNFPISRKVRKSFKPALMNPEKDLCIIGVDVNESGKMTRSYILNSLSKQFPWMKSDSVCKSVIKSAIMGEFIFGTLKTPDQFALFNNSVIITHCLELWENSLRCKEYYEFLYLLKIDLSDWEDATIQQLHKRMQSVEGRRSVMFSMSQFYQRITIEHAPLSCKNFRQPITDDERRCCSAWNEIRTTHERNTLVFKPYSEDEKEDPVEILMANQIIDRKTGIPQSLIDPFYTILTCIQKNKISLIEGDSEFALAQLVESCNRDNTSVPAYNNTRIVTTTHALATHIKMVIGRPVCHVSDFVSHEDIELVVVEGSHHMTVRQLAKLIKKIPEKAKLILCGLHQVESSGMLSSTNIFDLDDNVFLHIIKFMGVSVKDEKLDVIKHPPKIIDKGIERNRTALVYKTLYDMYKQCTKSKHGIAILCESPSGEYSAREIEKMFGTLEPLGTFNTGEMVVNKNEWAQTKVTALISSDRDGNSVITRTFNSIAIPDKLVTSYTTTECTTSVNWDGKLKRFLISHLWMHRYAPMDYVILVTESRETLSNEVLSYLVTLAKKEICIISIKQSDEKTIPRSSAPQQYICPFDLLK